MVLGSGWARARRRFGAVVVTAISVATITSCSGKFTRQRARASSERLYVFSYGSADVSGFDVDETGALSKLTGSPFPLRGSPISAVTVPGLETLFVADGARVMSYAIDAVNGALAFVGETSPGGASLVASGRSGNALYVADCVDSGGSLSVLPIASETGLAGAALQSIPTPFCVNGIVVEPSGRFLYASSQYAENGELAGFSIDQSSGTLTPLAGSPFASFLAVAIAVDPSGKRVYVCDQDALVRSYGIDAETGALVDLGVNAKTGGNPFSMAIEREGQRLFVGNWSDDSVSSYALNPTTGLPSEVPGSPYAADQAPHVLAVDASSRFVYVAGQDSEAIEVFAVGSSGGLSQLVGSPFTVGAQPSAAVVVP